MKKSRTENERTGLRAYTSLVRALLSWFAANARDLPWRRTTDPYAIWVSEIMLQQTQVKTVIPYWERWMQALPNIHALAEANSEKLHKLWEGLGYYTRVRNMQRAAISIVQKHDGIFPRRYDDVLALTGIGRYTAGAICSIAFNQPSAILDGNVARVLSRVFAVKGDPRQRKASEQLWKLSSSMVEAANRAEEQGQGRCSRLNQALMELGALVCKPREPDCPACPLRANCRARLQNRVAEFPQKIQRARPEERHTVAFIVRRGEKFLVRQRPAGTVNGHLWEFPGAELRNGEVAAVARATLGVRPSRVSHLLKIKHSITRYRITLDAWEVTLSARKLPDISDGSWVTRSQLVQLPFPSAHRKIAAALLHHS